MLLAAIVLNGRKILGFDKDAAIKNHDRFAEDIRNRLSFLFTECGAEIVPNEGVRFPPGFDYAYVTVVAGNVRFQFLHGRGELRVDIAPRQNPRDLNEISTVLRAIDALPGLVNRPAYLELRDFAHLLQTHWSALQQAFSEEQYARTKESLYPIQEQNLRAVRAMEAKIQGSPHRRGRTES